MAIHVLGPNEFGVRQFTLAAGVEDIVSWERPKEDAGYSTRQPTNLTVQIINEGGEAAVWYTVDNTAPAASSRTSQYIPAAQFAVSTVSVPAITNPGDDTEWAHRVRLIASAPVVVTVERVD